MAGGKRRPGRPSDYSQDLADRICAELADGRSLRSVCSDEGMPDKATVFRWLRTHKEFCDQYTRAKEEAADSLTDDMLDIADDARNDWMARYGEGDEAGGWMVNGEHIQRSRLRIETRKWIAAKLKPKKYGDKVEVSGKDGAPLITPVINVICGTDSRNQSDAAPEAGAGVSEPSD